jgi:Ferritin-like
MAVELSTIPLYLYAMYSVTPASGAANAVRNVSLIVGL